MTHVLINQLNISDLQIIYQEFSDATLKGVKPMREYLRKITIPQLQAKCAQLKFQCKETLKHELQTKVFKAILEGSQTKFEEDDEEADNPLVPENEPNS